MKASFNPISSRHCWYTVPQPFCPALPIAVVGVSGISVHVDSGSLHLQAESPVSLHQAFSETVCGGASQPGSTGELQPRGNPPAPGRESGVSPRVPFFRGTASPLSRAAPSLQQGCVHIGEQLRKPSSWRSLRLPCSGVLAVAQSLNHVWRFVIPWGILGSSFKLFALKSLHQENPNQGTVLFNTSVRDSEVTLSNLHEY